MKIKEILEAGQQPIVESANQALKEHLSRQVPLCDSLFRYQSDAYFQTFRLAKQLRSDGKLPELDWESEDMLRTDIGESVNLKGVGKVWLDVPYLQESFSNGDRVKMREPWAGGSREEFTLKHWDGETGWVLDDQDRGWRVDARQIELVDDQDDDWDDENDSPWDHSSIKESEELGVGDEVIVTYNNRYKGQVGTIIDFAPSGKFVIVDIQGDTVSMHLSDVELHDSDYDHDGQPTEYEEWQDYMGGDDWDHGQFDEAEYQGKNVELGKPKRGGDKKFYVYVRDPKSKNIRKVSFGAKSGGGNLAVKLKDPKARKAFADRHSCEQKNDKTKPGYWACRLPRYAKSLGLSGGGTWW
jgi:hypothetical protein